MGTDTSTTTGWVETGPALADAITYPADGYDVVRDYWTAMARVQNWARENLATLDQPFTRLTVTGALEQIDAANAHNRRRYTERKKARGERVDETHPYWNGPCCAHEAELRHEVAALREELADARAALVLADAELITLRRR